MDAPHNGEGVAMLLAVVLDIRNCPLCGNSAVGRAGNCVAVVEMSRLRSRARGNALLLVGPPDGGKTAVLSTVWRPVNVFQLTHVDMTSAGV